MQNSADFEVTQPLRSPVKSALRTGGQNGHDGRGGRIGRRSESRGRQQLVVASLVISDVLLALMTWGLAAAIQSVWGRGALSEASVATVASNIAVWVGLRWLLGLYPGYGLQQTEELRRQTLAVVTSVAITAVFSLTFHVGDLISRMLLIVGFLGLAVAAPLVRCFVKRVLIKAGVWGKPVVVLSFGEVGWRLVRQLKSELGLGLRPVAIFDSRVAPATGMVDSVPYSGTVSEAMDLGRTGEVDIAIFAMPHTRREHLFEFVKQARDSFKRIIIIPNLGGITNSAVVARDLGGTFGVEVKHTLLDPWTCRAKRVLDLMAVVASAVFVLPLIAVLSALVWLESGGPVFYRAERMGRNNELFTCLKFRTMVPDSETALQQLLANHTDLREEYSKYHKLRDDPRVTRVGRFLRKTSLDELPQLWNVLRGEMSLVGPRPYLPRESGDIGATQSDILRVYPGITGPWQVNGRNHTSFDERVQMDAFYVHNWSIWLDLLLLARTVRCVLLDRGAY